MSVQILPSRFTVDFEELDGSPTENISVEWEGISVNRSFRCAAADRMSLVKSFLGWTEYLGLNIIIHRPHVYTYISNDLMAYNAAIKPEGKIQAVIGDSRFANYPYATVEISYKIPQALMAECYGAFVTISETLQEASEFVTLPEEKLFWKVDGGVYLPLDLLDAPGKVNKLLEWTYEIRNALYMPPGIWGYPGHVNAYECYSRTFDIRFPAGTLLCGNPTVSKEVSFSATTFNILLRFLAKNNGTYLIPKGWNYFPNVGRSGVDVSFEPIYDSAGNPKIFYPFADFRNIFVP